MDNQFTNMSAFPQGMDFLKQLWAQGLAAQSAMPTIGNMAGMKAASATAATPTPPSTANAPNAASGMTQAFQQTMASYLMPTFDVEELDKRINDMRTVLQFMDMNTHMLRQSLQALEVQRNTVAALHGMMQSASVATATATTTAATPPTASAAASVASTSAAPTKKTRRKNTP